MDEEKKAGNRPRKKVRFNQVPHVIFHDDMQKKHEYDLVKEFFEQYDNTLKKYRIIKKYHGARNKDAVVKYKQALHITEKEVRKAFTFYKKTAQYYIKNNIDVHSFWQEQEKKPNLTEDSCFRCCIL